MGKLLKIVIGLAIGALVDEVAAELLEDVGVPPHAAKVAGAIAGAIV